jgi:GMP synthase (glutamine-hydrolysing)|tara:strand:- start:101 stop:757 length:657 start_codon:yes stop_codon:yes gene_type:complete
METYRTIAIINDPKVTLGSLSENNIEQKNAWDVNWDTLSLDRKYIILGGHMGAYDTDTYPYLIKEKEWLNKVVTAGTKVLGICLGAQLIAEAMGGKAFLSDQIEFGFKKLNFHIDQELLSGYISSKVFLWHRDTFSIPPSAKLIASTEYPQIFKIHNSYALQFHPEVTKELFEDWYESEVSRRELINHDVSSTLNHLIINEKTYKEEVNIFYEKWISY